MPTRLAPAPRAREALNPHVPGHTSDRALSHHLTGRCEYGMDFRTKWC